MRCKGLDVALLNPNECGDRRVGAPPSSHASGTQWANTLEHECDRVTNTMSAESREAGEIAQTIRCRKRGSLAVSGSCTVAQKCGWDGIWWRSDLTMGPERVSLSSLHPHLACRKSCHPPHWVPCPPGFSHALASQLFRLPASCPVRDTAVLGIWGCPLRHCEPTATFILGTGSTLHVLLFHKSQY